MGRMIRRFAALVLVGLLCGLCDLSVALAQSATAEQPGASTQQPQQDTSQPASSTPTDGKSTPGNASAPLPDQTDKQAEEPLPNAPSATQIKTSDQNQTPQPQRSDGEVPSGTAAATIGNPKGNLASKPAGAAIAPSQQHRGRSLLIKLGLVVGAGAALGSVFAFSQASPARPPGAH